MTQPLSARENKDAIEIIDRYGRVMCYQPAHSSDWKKLYALCMDWLHGIANDTDSDSYLVRSARLSSVSPAFWNNLELVCRRAADNVKIRIAK